MTFIFSCSHYNTWVWYEDDYSWHNHFEILRGKESQGEHKSVCLWNVYCHLSLLQIQQQKGKVFCFHWTSSADFQHHLLKLRNSCQYGVNFVAEFVTLGRDRYFHKDTVSLSDRKTSNFVLVPPSTIWQDGSLNSWGHLVWFPTYSKQRTF